MKTEHINITIPPDLREAVDQQAQREQTRRSTLIQKAVRIYLGLSRQKSFRALLKEGYAELSPEARRLEQEFSRLDSESLKYAD
jgi:metal-responsive CopG/Arc/MetJ family transcriptional regulator